MSLHEASPEQLKARRAKVKARKGWVRLGVAVILAIGAHGLVLLACLASSQLSSGSRDLAKMSSQPPRSVALRTLSPQQWSQNRKLADRASKLSPQAALPKKPEKPPPETRPNGQVVDVAPGNREKTPDAKYLAESSNKVQKQTRAKEQTAFYKNAMPKRTSSAPQTEAAKNSADRLHVSGNQGTGNDDRPLLDAQSKARAQELPDVHKRSEIAMKETLQGPGLKVSNRRENDQTQGNSEKLNLRPGGGSAEQNGSRGRPGTPGQNLLPSYSVLDKISGAAPNDHLKDAEEGEGTFLNTKEWKFAGFFNRVKQSIGMHWNPSPQLVLRDPTGNIYGGRDRYTLVKVTLDEKGLLRNVSVEKSCGVEFLDREAISAFERAQPFPNPPAALLGADATVQFSFGFFLDFGGGGGVRLFRYNNP